MHVLFVTQYFHPEVGATQTRILEFARACRRHGYRVTVLTELPNHPQGRIHDEYRGRLVQREVFEGFDVLRVWVWTRPTKTTATRLAFYASFFAMGTACGAALIEDVDVVFATSPPLSVGLIGWLLARRHRARFVLDVRDLWPAVVSAVTDVRQPRMLRAAERVESFLYRRAERVTAVTQGFVRHIRQAVPDPTRVVWLPNGAATDLFDPSRADPDLRRRLGLDNAFVVTFAGLHGLAQGLDVVLHTAARLAERPEFVFLLIGDGPAKAALVERARALHLPNVRFLPIVPTADIAPYLIASDALLVPLRPHPVFDTFVPSKLYDYLACGRPVILSVDGEAREVLEASAGGLFCCSGDERAMADAILKLFSLSSHERARMGASGRAYVLQHFSRGIQSVHLLDLLQQTVEPA